MLPPNESAQAFTELLTELRGGRLDPEAHLTGIEVPLSQLVRIRKTIEAVGSTEAVLQYFGLAPERWSEAQKAWGSLLYVLELRAKYQYWSETLDVTAESASLRAQLGHGAA